MRTKDLKGAILLYIKVIHFIGKSKMPSDNGVTAYLKGNDKKLFEKAVKKYGMNKSELLKRIIGNWLFENKLQLENQND